MFISILSSAPGAMKFMLKRTVPEVVLVLATSVLLFLPQIPTKARFSFLAEEP